MKNIYRTYKPGRGTIFLNDRDILDFSYKKMAGEMAVMAQENHVEFDFEVREMVMFGRYAKKNSCREIRRQIGSFAKNACRR